MINDKINDKLYTIDVYPGEGLDKVPGRRQNFNLNTPRPGPEGNIMKNVSKKFHPRSGW